LSPYKARVCRARVPAVRLRRAVLPFTLLLVGCSSPVKREPTAAAPVPPLQYTNPLVLSMIPHANGQTIVELRYYTPEPREQKTALVRLGPDLRPSRTVHLPKIWALAGSLGERAVVRNYLQKPEVGPDPLVFGATLPPADPGRMLSVLAAVDFDTGRATTLWAPPLRQFKGIDIRDGRAAYSNFGDPGSLVLVRLEEQAR